MSHGYQIINPNILTSEGNPTEVAVFDLSNSTHAQWQDALRDHIYWREVKPADRDYWGTMIWDTTPFRVNAATLSPMLEEAMAYDPDLDGTVVPKMIEFLTTLPADLDLMELEVLIY